MRGENAANIYAKQCEIIHNPILPMLLRITYDAQSQLHSKSCCEGYTRVEHDFRLWERFTNADANVEGWSGKCRSPSWNWLTSKSMTSLCFQNFETACWSASSKCIRTGNALFKLSFCERKCMVWSTSHKNTHRRNNSYSSGISHSSEWISQTKHTK